MTTDKNGKGPDGAGASTPPLPQVQIVRQFIKDFSFENPNIENLIDGPGGEPNLNLEVNVGAQKRGEELYESVIDFKAHAANKAGTIYELELVYAGLFRARNIPEAALEPFLLINCPSLLFPFLRRLVADISREGGYPPLMLDPIDFAGLFARRKQSTTLDQSKSSGA